MDGEKHFNDGGEKGQKCMRGKNIYIYLILDFLPFHNPSLQRESRFSTRYSRYTKVTGLGNHLVMAYQQTVKPHYY